GLRGVGERHRRLARGPPGAGLVRERRTPPTTAQREAEQHAHEAYRVAASHRPRRRARPAPARDGRFAAAVAARMVKVSTAACAGGHPDNRTSRSPPRRPVPWVSRANPLPPSGDRSNAVSALLSTADGPPEHGTVRDGVDLLHAGREVRTELGGGLLA